MNKMYSILIIFLLLTGCGGKEDSDVINTGTGNGSGSTPTTGSNAPTKTGQVSIDFSIQAGNKRSFYLSLPDNYSKDTKYKLVLIFPGTNTTGLQMRNYVGDGWSSSTTGIEPEMPNTIFVYPDPKWRDFPNWGNLGGWLLGPHAGNAKGNEDINFIGELIEWLEKNYSIDSDRIFATGHSWGGDMTAILGCFLGDKFRAIAPVAANRPYWFENGSILSSETLNCKGNPAVWTFYGNNDEHFDGQEPEKGDFGREQNQFWLDKYNCGNKPEYYELEILPKGESLEYKNCTNTVRFTLYSPNFSGNSSQPGHQPPDYYLIEVPKWFNSF